MGRLELELGLGLALGLQLGIGIGFRRNHSWSSIFTPRCNHSLCQITTSGYRPNDEQTSFQTLSEDRE